MLDTLEPGDMALALAPFSSGNTSHNTSPLKGHTSRSDEVAIASPTGDLNEEQLLEQLLYGDNVNSVIAEVKEKQHWRRLERREDQRIQEEAEWEKVRERNAAADMASKKTRPHTTGLMAPPMSPALPLKTGQESQHHSPPPTGGGAASSRGPTHQLVTPTFLRASPERLRLAQSFEDESTEQSGTAVGQDLQPPIQSNETLRYVDPSPSIWRTRAPVLTPSGSQSGSPLRGSSYERQNAYSRQDAMRRADTTTTLGQPDAVSVTDDDSSGVIQQGSQIYDTMQRLNAFHRPEPTSPAAGTGAPRGAVDEDQYNTTPPSTNPYRFEPRPYEGRTSPPAPGGRHPLMAPPMSPMQSAPAPQPTSGFATRVTGGTMLSDVDTQFSSPPPHTPILPGDPEFQEPHAFYQEQQYGEPEYQQGVAMHWYPLEPPRQLSVGDAYDPGDETVIELRRRSRPGVGGKTLVSPPEETTPTTEKKPERRKSGSRVKVVSAKNTVAPTPAPTPAAAARAPLGLVGGMKALMQANKVIGAFGGAKGMAAGPAAAPEEDATDEEEEYTEEEEEEEDEEEEYSYYSYSYSETSDVDAEDSDEDENTRAMKKPLPQPKVAVKLEAARPPPISLNAGSQQQQQPTKAPMGKGLWMKAKTVAFAPQANAGANAKVSESPAPRQPAPAPNTGPGPAAATPAPQAAAPSKNLWGGVKSTMLPRTGATVVAAKNTTANTVPAPAPAPAPAAAARAPLGLVGGMKALMQANKVIGAFGGAKGMAAGPAAAPAPQPQRQPMPAQGPAPQKTMHGIPPSAMISAAPRPASTAKPAPKSTATAPVKAAPQQAKKKRESTPKTKKAKKDKSSAKQGASLQNESKAPAPDLDTCPAPPRSRSQARTPSDSGSVSSFITHSRPGGGGPGTPSVLDPDHFKAMLSGTPVMTFVPHIAIIPQPPSSRSPSTAAAGASAVEKDAVATGGARKEEKSSVDKVDGTDQPSEEKESKPKEDNDEDGKPQNPEKKDETAAESTSKSDQKEEKSAGQEGGHNESLSPSRSSPRAEPAKTRGGIMSPPPTPEVKKEGVRAFWF